jgi:hypothetical protein
VFAGPVALTLAKDATYRLAATFDPAGPITVTVAERETTRGTLSGIHS